MCYRYRRPLNLESGQSQASKTEWAPSPSLLETDSHGRSAPFDHSYGDRAYPEAKRTGVGQRSQSIQPGYNRNSYSDDTYGRQDTSPAQASYRNSASYLERQPMTYHRSISQVPSNVGYGCIGDMVPPNSLRRTDQHSIQYSGTTKFQMNSYSNALNGERHLNGHIDEHFRRQNLTNSRRRDQEPVDLTGDDDDQGVSMHYGVQNASTHSPYLRGPSRQRRFQQDGGYQGREPRSSNGIQRPETRRALSNYGNINSNRANYRNNVIEVDVSLDDDGWLGEPTGFQSNIPGLGESAIQAKSRNKRTLNQEQSQSLSNSKRANLGKESNSNGFGPPNSFLQHDNGRRQSAQKDTRDDAKMSFNTLFAEGSVANQPARYSEQWDQSAHGRRMTILEDLEDGQLRGHAEYTRMGSKQQNLHGQNRSNPITIDDDQPSIRGRSVASQPHSGRFSNQQPSVRPSSRQIPQDNLNGSVGERSATPDPKKPSLFGQILGSAVPARNGEQFHIDQTNQQEEADSPSMIDNDLAALEQHAQQPRSHGTDSKYSNVRSLPHSIGDLVGERRPLNELERLKNVVQYLDQKDREQEEIMLEDIPGRYEKQEHDQANGFPCESAIDGRRTDIEVEQTSTKTLPKDTQSGISFIENMIGQMNDGQPVELDDTPRANGGRTATAVITLDDDDDQAIPGSETIRGHGAQNGSERKFKKPCLFKSKRYLEIFEQLSQYHSQNPNKAKATLSGYTSTTQPAIDQDRTTLSSVPYHFGPQGVANDGPGKELKQKKLVKTRVKPVTGTGKVVQLKKQLASEKKQTFCFALSSTGSKPSHAPASMLPPHAPGPSTQRPIRQGSVDPGLDDDASDGPSMTMYDGKRKLKLNKYHRAMHKDEPLRPAILGRPTLGGKNLSRNFYREWRREIDQLKDELFKSDTSSDSKANYYTRQESPFNETDFCHYEYQVVRKTWGKKEAEEDVEWHVCGQDSYWTTIKEANEAAGREIMRGRYGFRYGPEVTHLTRDLDQFGLCHYYLVSPKGFTRVQIRRYIRNATNGKKPSTKEGWIRRYVYDVHQKTTIEEMRTVKIIKVPKASMEDDLFDGEEETEEEHNEKEEVKTTTTKIVDGPFTILDQANRVAAEFVLEMGKIRKSMRMDEVLEQQERKRKMEERLTEIEDNDETFRETVQVHDEKKMVEIWVEKRELKGPRNI